MTFPPESTKTSLQQRLSEHARAHWPAIASLQVRFWGKFAYVSAVLDEPQDTPGYGIPVPLMRLRYGGSASTWGFGFYRASHEDCIDSMLPDGSFTGSPQEALACAAGVYAAPHRP